MAIIKLKRRSSGGAAGAPSSLKSGEPAYNEADDKLYYGKGDDGGGNATSIVEIGGTGAFVDKSNAQTVAGKKTFSTVPASSQDASAGTDLVRKSQMDTSLGLKANLASPALTGTPTAPTATTATNNTQIATTAYVKAVVASLIDSAPGALDTLNELAAALGNDPNFASTITTSLAGKADLTLSNLSNVATARTSLGLGTIATQAADNVAITGGSITGATIDGGTF